MIAIRLASFAAVFIFICFVVYPEVAHFKDPVCMFKATVFNVVELIYLHDFANTPT